MSKEETEEKDVSRRQYVAAVGGLVAGLAVGFAGGYITAPGKVVEKEVTVEVVKKTYGPWEPYEEKPATPLKWVHWGYRPDIIAENIGIFCEQNNENVEEEMISADYQPMVETKWMAGEVFDVCYGNDYMAFRWRALGYTRPPEGGEVNGVYYEPLPFIEWIKNDMFPSVRKAYSWLDGKLAGLTYFVSAVPAMVANDVILEAAGMAGEYPETWNELYDMCRELKKRAPPGMIKPYVPRFFNAFWGSPWDLTAEVSNKAHDPDLTKTMWDKDFGCLFDAAPGDYVYETIKDWRALVEEDLIEKAVLTAATNAPGEEAFYTGKYAFIGSHGLYGYWSIMDPAKCVVAGQCTLIPPTAKQNWGVIDTGLYCMPTKVTDEERARRFVQWLGWKDNYGRIYTATKWAKEEFLHSAYPAVYEQEEVKEAWRTRLGDKLDHTIKASSGYLAGMAIPWIRRSPLYGEWMDPAADYMARALVGEITVEECVRSMRELSDELWQKYHGK